MTRMIQGNTQTAVQVAMPVSIRVDGQPKAKALAFSSGCNSALLSRQNRFEGGKQAVAECWRNLNAVGALSHLQPQTT